MAHSIMLGKATVHEMLSNAGRELVKNVEHLRIRLKDIKSATFNFSIGKESNRDYIAYYRAKLKCFDREYLPSSITKNKSQPPKRLYIVRIELFQRPDDAMFYRNVEIASSCKHQNIQPLLGFCDEGSHRILVYKYYSYREKLPVCLVSRNLTWEQRLEVCLNIGQGLHYLHYEMEDQNTVIYNNLSIDNIVLDDNWGAQILGFDSSVFLPPNQDEVVLDLDLRSTFDHRHYYYKDPEYLGSFKTRRESDVYSFGVVMSQILFGYSIDEIFRNIKNYMGDKGKLKKKICPKLWEENGENNSFLPKGPNEDSLDMYLEIMYECLAPTHDQRSTMKVVVMKLEKAISLQCTIKSTNQLETTIGYLHKPRIRKPTPNTDGSPAFMIEADWENHKDNFRMSYEDIKSATQNFRPQNYVGGGGFGGVYKGEIARGNGHQTIVAKRLDTRLGQGEQQYYNELQILCEYKHANVIGLVGYNNETRERIIVYEHASRGSLDRYLNDSRLTWKKRLNICIDVASGLAFLHGDAETGQEVVIHRDIKTQNILLFDDWKAKVGDFGLSLITTLYKDKNYIIDHACGTKGYVDPVYEKTRFLTIESDIYSFGVVLFEILCGRSTYSINKNEGLFLDFVKHSFEEGKQDEMVFEVIKKQIMPKSLTTFQMIAYRCLHDDRKKRPTAKEVLAQLKMALEYQSKKLLHYYENGIINYLVLFLIYTQEENNLQEPDVMDLSGKLEDINLKLSSSLNQTA
ncbi:serine/threonine/dual specificity protein kinase, catalytic domain-containing protein [Artemisia annua]|uniref:Serine/threonine/dual specificity protein kinase, catalytic domain-containing protein n=1 Tax=Artemisia annua TaxID=35608 RepID=A0A2U1M2M0_ARTAN|nr:serine/threonine/dual specificity protein kinase, catalytic domain-containing protein [Artemisia annua]